MKRKCLILLGIILVLGVCALWGLNRMAVSIKSREIALPDGTVLAVESISYGKKHILRGKGTRLIDQLLPPKELDRYEGNYEELVLFMRQSPRSTVLQPNSLGRNPWAGLDIRDDAGGYSRGMTESHSGQSPDYVRFSASDFPRRGKQLTLTFYNQQSQPIGSLRFANPAPNPPPQWQPDTFPATRTKDNLTFTLEEPKFSPYIYGLGLPFDNSHPSYTAQEIAERGIKPGEIPFRRLIFSTTENSKPSRDWGVWIASEEDIYGHTTHRQIGAANSRIADYYLPLPTNENIRLKLVVQKRTSAPIKPEEIWSFAPIIPPAEGSILTLPKAKPLPNGVEIVKGEVMSAKVYKANARGYAVAFELRGLPETSRFVLEAKDENGKFVGNSYARRWIDTDQMNNAPSSWRSQSKLAVAVRHTFVIEAKQPLKQLTLTARVLPGKTFDFILPGTYKPPQ